MQSDHPAAIRGNVFVANLAHGTTDEQLAAMFDPYGVVLRAYVARDLATGEALDHGLVELAPDEAVEDAVAAVSTGGIDARRADPEMGLTPLVRSRVPSAAPPRFVVERQRPPARVHVPSTGARVMPPVQPVRDRPTLRLSLPDRSAGGRAATVPAGGERWR